MAPHQLFVGPATHAVAAWSAPATNIPPLTLLCNVHASSCITGNQRPVEGWRRASFLSADLATRESRCGIGATTAKTIQQQLLPHGGSIPRGMMKVGRMERHGRNAPAIMVPRSTADGSSGESAATTGTSSGSNSSTAPGPFDSASITDPESAQKYLKSIKHILLPILDNNPYLHDGTKETIALAVAMAKTLGSRITVVVIDDEDNKETKENLELRLKNIRWHMGNNAFEEYGLLERPRVGSYRTAELATVADELNVDLVVMSSEAIHERNANDERIVNANLLAEFLGCPLLLLPL